MVLGFHGCFKGIGLIRYGLDSWAGSQETWPRGFGLRSIPAFWAHLGEAHSGFCLRCLIAFDLLHSPILLSQCR